MPVWHRKKVNKNIFWKKNPIFNARAWQCTNESSTHTALNILSNHVTAQKILIRIASDVLIFFYSVLYFLSFRSSPKTPKLGAVSIPPKFRHGLAYISRIQVLLIWIGKKPPCRTGSAQEGMANGRVHSNIIDARRQRKKRRKKKGKEGSVRYATASCRLERHAPLGMNIQLGHSFFLCPEANNNWIHAHALHAPRSLVVPLEENTKSNERRTDN